MHDASGTLIEDNKKGGFPWLLIGVAAAAVIVFFWTVVSIAGNSSVAGAGEKQEVMLSVTALQGGTVDATELVEVETIPQRQPDGTFRYRPVLAPGQTLDEFVLNASMALEYALSNGTPVIIHEDGSLGLAVGAYNALYLSTDIDMMVDVGQPVEGLYGHCAINAAHGIIADAQRCPSVDFDPFLDTDDRPDWYLDALNDDVADAIEPVVPGNVLWDANAKS